MIPQVASIIVVAVPQMVEIRVVMQEVMVTAQGDSNMINEAGYERFQLMGFAALATGIALTTTEHSPLWACFIGLLVFLFGTYFRTAEIFRMKVVAMEESEEVANGYQADLFGNCIYINEVCRECESFGKCTSHDPHAGCENEVQG